MRVGREPNHIRPLGCSSRNHLLLQYVPLLPNEPQISFRQLKSLRISLDKFNFREGPLLATEQE